MGGPSQTGGAEGGGGSCAAANWHTDESTDLPWGWRHSGDKAARVL